MTRNHVQVFVDFALWLKREGHGSNSVRKYVRIAQRFAESFKGVRATSTQIAAWRSSLDLVQTASGPRPAAPATINLNIAALRAFFTFCVETGLRRDNPLKNSAIKILPVPKRKAKPITREDLKALYETVYSTPISPVALQDRAMLEVLFGSGLRRDEVAHVQLKSFAVPEQLRIIGKGNKERITITTAPETVAVQEWAKAHLFDEGATAILSQILDATPAESRDRVYATARNAAFADLMRRCPETFLFYNVSGDEVGRTPLATLEDPGAAIWRRCQVWFRRAGVSATPHKFRHSFATTMLSAGATHREIGTLLGHEDERSTSIYTGTEDSLFTRLRALHPLAEQGAR